MLVLVLVFITLCPFLFCNHLWRKRELAALLLLSFRYLVTVNVLWHFLTVPWVGLQCVIVVLWTKINTHFAMVDYKKLYMTRLSFTLGSSKGAYEEVIPTSHKFCRNWI